MSGEGDLGDKGRWASSVVELPCYEPDVVEALDDVVEGNLISCAISAGPVPRKVCKHPPVEIQ